MCINSTLFLPKFGHNTYRNENTRNYPHMKTDYSDIIDFFNLHAHRWDSCQKEKDFSAISKIMERSRVNSNHIILDVGCGSGVLTECLIRKGCCNISGIDISNNMIDIFQKKFPDIPAVNANYEKHPFPDKSFDRIFIFNSFPHFINSESVFNNSFNFLKKNGQLIIAHSMNREKLNQHHKLAGKQVENDILIPDDSFMELYIKSGFKNIAVDNSNYFYSKGEK